MPRLKPKKKIVDRQRRFPFDWHRHRYVDNPLCREWLCGEWVVTNGAGYTAMDLTDAIASFVRLLETREREENARFDWLSWANGRAGGPTPGLWGDTMNRPGNNNAQT